MLFWYAVLYEACRLADMNNLQHPQLPQSAALFLLFEGIPATVFESQVLMHAARMRELGMQMDVCAFAPKAGLFALSHGRLSALDKQGISVSLHRCMRTSIPGARIVNALLLWRFLSMRKIRYDFLHCRTEYAAAVASILKMVNGPPVIWDARGDTAAESAASFSKTGLLNRFLRKWRLTWVASNLKMAARGCTTALFVSKALRQCQGAELGSKRTEIIPCVAEERIFHFDPALRLQTRATLQLADEDSVFIFSGSLAPWQCFPETVELFCELYAQAPEKTKFLVLTPDLDEARIQFKNIPDTALRFASVSLSAVNAYLNAADFGVLLRHATPINHVASPVKFAEYALTGLTVLSTAAIAQVQEFGQVLGNVVNCEAGLPALERKTEQMRAELAEASAGLLGRSAMDKRYLDIYRDTMAQDDRHEG